MDGLPILSQLKSLAQAITGDVDGAERTQQNFIRRCPVVSQITSAVQAIQGDEVSALETQKEFVRELDGALVALPAVGHVIGGVKYACGNKEGGDAAMKAASRSTGQVAAGVGGFLVGGPPGAIAGAVAGGVAVDGLITGITAAVDEEPDLYGVVGLVRNVCMDDGERAGNVVDLCGQVLLDGLGGRAIGKQMGKGLGVEARAKNVVKGQAKGCAKRIERNCRRTKERLERLAVMRLEYGLCVRALYDYEADDDDEITFDAGDIITQVDQSDEEWWEGVGPDGMQGLFRADLVEELM